jgi:hypothetical protein
MDLEPLDGSTVEKQSTQERRQQFTNLGIRAQAMVLIWIKNQ